MKALAAVFLCATITLAAAQSPPSISDDTYIQMCSSSTGTSPQSCACQIRVGREVFTPEEVKWVGWYLTDRQAAEKAMAKMVATSSEKAIAMGYRLIAGGAAIGQRCDHVP
jgi:hypothetical protein